jgi:tripartite-type tricarboxylate transporter receptor subunit TctC
MRGLVSVIAGLACCGLALAQDYPAKPVRILISHSAGSSPDLVMRVVADRLSRSLGQQFFIENKPGAESVIGAEAAAHSAPDGYTLYAGSGDAMVVNRFRFKSLSYDADKEFTPIANVIDSAPFVVALHPDVPAKTFQELISVAKSRPGQLSYGFTIGVSDILGRWINKTAGVEFARVPYRQNPQAVQDALTGQIQVLLISWPSVEQFVKAGKLRVIAVSSDKRFPTLPETPTIAETYPGLVVEGWFALYGPVGVPLAVIQRLQPELDRILRDPEVLQRVQSYGFTTSGAQTPAWVLAHMQEDVARWRKIAQDVDLQPQ